MVHRMPKADMMFLRQLLLLVCLSSTLTLATVSINNNGYRGIEIVIHEDVPENETLLQTIVVRNYSTEKNVLQEISV